MRSTGERTAEPEIVEIKGKQYLLKYGHFKYCVECGSLAIVDIYSTPTMHYDPFDGKPIFQIKMLCEKTKDKWFVAHSLPSILAKEIEVLQVSGKDKEQDK